MAIIFSVIIPPNKTAKNELLCLVSQSVQNSNVFITILGFHCLAFKDLYQISENVVRSHEGGAETLFPHK